MIICSSNVSPATPRMAGVRRLLLLHEEILSKRDHSDAVPCCVRLADEFGGTRQIAAIQGELFQARALLLRCDACRVIAR